MKIASIINENVEFSSYNGGATEEWVYQVFKRLEDKEIECTVFGNKIKGQKDFSKEIKFKELKTSYLKQIIKPLANFTGLKRLNRVSNYYHSFSSSLKMRKNYDYIHIQNRPLFVPIIHRFNSNSEIILHMHNHHLENLEQKRGEKILDKTSKVLANSEFTADKIEGKYSDYTEKVKIVRNGIDTEEFSPVDNEEKRAIKQKLNLEGEKVILFVGRVMEEKGVDLLIKAFNRLKNQEDLKLVIVGSSWFGEELKGEYYQELEDISENIEEKIKFTGYVSKEKLIYYYQSSDLCVFPSRWEEPFGMVTLEGMSCGKPVITSNRGGLPEVVGDVGITINPENIDELSSEISKLLHNEELRKDIGEQSRKRVEENFTWDIVAEEFKEKIN